MQEWGRGKLDELAGENLCGYIFKSKSPSSGMERIKVYDKNGVPVKIGDWYFRSYVHGALSHCYRWRTRAVCMIHCSVKTSSSVYFIMKRLRELMTGTSRRGGLLVEFHTRHKMLDHGPQSPVLS